MANVFDQFDTQESGGQGANVFDQFDDSLTAGEHTSQVLSGGYEGLAASLGLPADIINAGLNAIGLDTADAPVGGSESLNKLFTKFGLIGPDTEEGHFGRRVGKEVGAAIPFAAIPAAAALKAAPVITSTTGVGTRVGQALVEPFRQAPRLAAGTEALAATTGGLGAATAREIAPGSPTAETIGQIGGALSPAILGALPVPLIKRGISRFGPEAQAQKAGETLRKVLGKEITEDVAEDVRAAMGTAAQIEGLKPSLAETSGKQSLITTQKIHEAKLSGEMLEAAIKRHDDNTKAIDAFASGQAPKSDTDVDIVLDAAESRVNNLRSALDDETQSITARRKAAGESPYTNRQQAGQAIREALIERRSEVSQEMSDMADEIGLNDLDFAPEFEVLREELITTMTPAGRFADASKTPDIIKVLESDRGVNLPVTFDDLKSLRESMSDEIRSSLAGTNVDKAKARNLRMGLEKLDAYINDLPMLEGSDIDYKGFRDTYYHGFIRKFDQGVMSKVRRKDGSGYYATADEDVAKQFWGPGKETALDQFNEVFGFNPEMMGNLRDVVLDDMMASVTRDGVIKQNLLDNWVKKHRGVLDKVPEIKATVLNRQSANDAMVRRQSMLDARQRQIGDVMLTRRLKSYSKGEKPAESIVAEAVSKPRMMKQLMNSVRDDKEAMSALKRHVWDDIVSNDATAMQKVMAENREGLTMALGDKHMKNLDTIMKARAMVEKVTPPSGEAITGGALQDIEKRIGVDLATVLTRVYQQKAGFAGGKWAVIATTFKGLKNRSANEMERLMDQALYDPEMAEILATLTVKEPNKAMVNKFNRRLLASGLRAYTLEEENDK